MKIEEINWQKQEYKLIARLHEKELWPMFAKHHYMDHKLPPGATFWTFYLKNDTHDTHDTKEELIGCAGVIFQQSKLPAKRITRFVILPEFQNLGLSKDILNMIGQYYLDNNFLMYIVTFHPRLGNALTNSDSWSPTIHNRKTYKSHESSKKFTSSNLLREGQKMFRFKYVPPIRYKYDTITKFLDVDLERADKFEKEIMLKIYKEKQKQEEKAKKEKELDKEMFKGALPTLFKNSKDIKKRKDEIRKKLRQNKKPGRTRSTQRSVKNKDKSR